MLIFNIKGIIFKMNVSFRLINPKISVKGINEFNILGT